MAPQTMQLIDLKMNKSSTVFKSTTIGPSGPVRSRGRRCLEAAHSNDLRRFTANLFTIIISTTLLMLVQSNAKAESDTKLAESSLPASQNEAGPSVEHLLDPILIAHRRGKLDDGDGFIMKTGNGEHHQSNLTPTTIQPDEELTTTNANLRTDLAANCSENVRTTRDELDSGQIPINSTRQHFLTHDQLITSSSREDQADVQQPTSEHQHQQPAAVSMSSRSAMPRLSLFTDLFKSRQQPAALNTQQADEHQAASHQNNKQQPGRCPGVCLNVLTATYRCQNALPAPCPLLFQRCCETDRVPFDGTPVETSAPILVPDSDSNSTLSLANGPKSSLADQTDATESLPENLRAPASSKDPTGNPQQHGQRESGGAGQQAPSDGQQQQQQHESSAPSLSPISRLHPTAAAAAEPPKVAPVQSEPGDRHLRPNGDAGNQLHDDDQSRSIYFLSSGADSTTTAPADERHQQQQQQPSSSSSSTPEPEPEQDGQHLGQQHKLSAPKSAAADLAQHSGGDTKPAASQSFDSPLSSTTTTTTPTSSTTNSPPGERMIMIQTVNGTALWHRGQLTPSAIQSVIRQSSRPLYANRSDFQQKQLMHNLRQPQLGPVVYHSNTDPVRRPAAQEATGPTAAAAPIDLSGSRQAAAASKSTQTSTLTSTTTTTVTPEPDSKVLKDQHSASSSPQQQQQPVGEASGQTGAETTQSDQSNSHQISSQSQLAASSAETIPQIESVATTTTSIASGEPTSQMAPADQQQVGTNDQGAGSSAVGGIASFLGSLLYDFMSSPSDSAAATSAENEARAPFEAQMQMQPQANVQHNDRRLGLDPTGVQNQPHYDNNQTQTQYAAENANDVGADQNNANQQDASGYRCNLQQQDGAYSCVNLLFTTQCGLSYPSSDCPALSRCCVDTSKLAPCNGQCLPLFRQSVCTEPNRLQTGLSNCPADHVCCSSASSSSGSGSGFGSEGQNLAELGEGQSNLAQEQSSSSRNQLAIGLVPQPTIVNANNLNEAQQQQTTLAASNRYAQANLFNQQQAPASGSLSQVVSSVPTPSTQSAGSGIINQIFQYMFKSNANGNKQRTRQQAPQTLPPPQQQTQPMLGYDPQVGYNRQIVAFQQAQAPQLVASASNLAATTLLSSPLQQQQQQQAFATMRNQVNLQQPSPMLMSASGAGGGGQTFAIASQPLPVNYHQTLLMNRNKQANGNVAESYLAPESSTRFVAMQKQFGQQAPSRQAQLHPHPTQFVTAEQQQQQVALMNAAANNQMNYMMTHSHQHQQTPSQPNQNRATFQQNKPAAQVATVGPKLVPVVQSNGVNVQQFQQQSAVNFGQQQPTRWTYSAQFAPSDLVPASANAQQQQQVSIRQQIQPNSVKQFHHNQANSFKPLAAGHHNQQQQQQQQYAVWTATSSLGHERPNSDQELAGERRAKPVASAADSVVAVASRPHNPETADTDVVSALSQQATGDRRTQSKFGTAHQDQQHQLAAPVRPATVPKIVATSSTALPPAQNARRPNEQFGLASNLSPIHAASDEADDGDDSDSATSSQAAPLDDSPRPTFGSSQSDSDQTELSFTQQPPTATTMNEPELIVAEDAATATEPTPLVASHSHDQQVPATTNSSVISTDEPATTGQHQGKVLATCGLPGPSRLDLRLNSVAAAAAAGRARSGRVMGGIESASGYWCWQVALMNDKNEYLCGGALIGTKWVLTAAHCVTERLRNEARLYVRLGQSNLNTTNPDEHRAARNVLVRKSYVHHNHNDKTMDNDIALLGLDEAVDLGAANICTICLPERNNPSKQLEAGRRCIVTGYGYETEEGPAALRVHEVDLPLVDDADCQAKLSAGLQRPVTLPSNSFCAGGELGKDACTGDGGSPLFCLEDGYYVLEGLVSWGYGCGKMSGLFAKVANFVGWINQIVSVNS